MKKTNLELLDFCLQRQELLADPHFSEMNTLIITSSKDESNTLLDAYNALNEYIVCYKRGLDDNIPQMQRDYLDKIVEVLEHENINYAEFPSFWSALDTSYSLYQKEMSRVEKKNFVEQALKLYINKRYEAYRNHGMSPVVLQVSSDSYAHKRNSGFAKEKVERLLEAEGYEQYNENVNDIGELCRGFNQQDAAFRVISSSNEPFYEAFLQEIQETSDFLSGRRAKAPDFVVKKGNSIYIIEHKHLKEGGGGQDKQMDELIEFIAQRPNNPNVHYVSYLDGFYFNIIIKKELERIPNSPRREAKPQSQLRNIRQNLANNGSNYFVNTAGFKELINR
ncbi:MAG: hypothetical protein WCY84_06365 [Candidatus Cloacimonadaceae bacterium]